MIAKLYEYTLLLIDFVLHIDRYLDFFIRSFGNYTYLILFMIVFCETGLVVTPFLPGDSLLFAVGAFSALGSLNAKIAWIVLFSAAIIGDNLNYWIGRSLGPKVFHYEKSRFFKKEYLERTHAFFEKHGGKTVIIARFMPIIRTFSPFVAGIGKMEYKRFLAYDIFGGFIWVTGFISLGFFFGNLPVVKRNFTLVIFAIIFISLLPGIISFLKIKFGKKNV